LGQRGAEERRYLPKNSSAAERNLVPRAYSETRAPAPISPACALAPSTRGDHFPSSNGQKVWTSGAHFADLVLPPGAPPTRKRRNITASSYLLVDMKTPGIEVRPLVLLNGHRPLQTRCSSRMSSCPRRTLVGPRSTRAWKVTTTTFDVRARAGAGGPRPQCADRATCSKLAKQFPNRPGGPPGRESHIPPATGASWRSRPRRLQVDPALAAGLTPPSARPSRPGPEGLDPQTVSAPNWRPRIADFSGTSARPLRDASKPRPRDRAPTRRAWGASRARPPGNTRSPAAPGEIQRATSSAKRVLGLPRG